MEIHKPHAAKSWSEFFIEIATVVIGILIAIGLEQIVERIHWAHEVRDAQSALRGEMAVADKTFAFRAAAASCVSHRLDELETVVENVAAGRRERSVKNSMEDVARRLSDNVWQSERASQTLTHFPEAELLVLSRYYQQLGDMRTWIHEEHLAWAQLGVLDGDPNRLGPGDISELRIALKVARDRNHYIALNSPLADSEAFGLKKPPVSAAAIKAACAPLDH